MAQATVERLMFTQAINDRNIDMIRKLVRDADPSAHLIVHERYWTTLLIASDELKDNVFKMLRRKNPGDELLKEWWLKYYHHPNVVNKLRLAGEPAVGSVLPHVTPLLLVNFLA